MGRPLEIYHTLVEFRGCAPDVDDQSLLIDVARQAAESVGATTLGETGVSYGDHGTTVIVFLAESHIVLTTWPEHDLVLGDILLCNPQMDEDLVVARLTEGLAPDGGVHVQKVMRHIGSERPDPAPPRD